MRRLLLSQILADINGDSHDNDKTLNDVGVGGVDVHELQSNFHQLEDQHADQDAGDSVLYLAFDLLGGGELYITVLESIISGLQSVAYR